jgi:transcriptional regulator with XRE-family HTH domain
VYDLLQSLRDHSWPHRGPIQVGSDLSRCHRLSGQSPLTRAELASRSGVSVRTIAGFESGEHQPIPAILAALQRVLEEAGIDFINADRSGGAGVRLAKQKARR